MNGNNGGKYITNKALLGVLIAVVVALVSYVFVSSIGRIDAKDSVQDDQISSIIANQATLISQLSALNAKLDILLPNFKGSETTKK